MGGIWVVVDKKLGIIGDSKKRLKFLIIIIVVLIITSMTIFIGYRSGYIYNDFSVVATINGEPVYAKEFNLKLKKTSNELLGSTSPEELNQNASEKQSTKSLRVEEVTDSHIRNEALENVKKLKIQQILAKDKGIIKSTDYKHFLELLKKENDIRKDAIKSNKVVFGPDKYGESEYFAYYFEDIIKQLREDFKKNYNISQTEILEYYNSTKESFKLPDDVKIQKISVTFSQSEQKSLEEDKRKAKEKIQEIKNLWDKGTDFKDILKRYDRLAKFYELSLTEEENSELVSSNLLNQIKTLKKGEISNIIENTMEFTVVKCLNRENVGYKSLEDAKEVIVNNIIQQKYEEYIDSLAKKAEVKVNYRILDKLKVR